MRIIWVDLYNMEMMLQEGGRGSQFSLCFSPFLQVP